VEVEASLTTNGKRTYIITTNRMISGEALK
jgi:hypothetical protein